MDTLELNEPTSTTPSPQETTTLPPPRRMFQRRARLMAALIFLVLLVAVNLAIGSGKVQFERVVSASMEPTLLIEDVIVADANAAPQRYDIICLTSPEDKDEKLVKRIIGLPGDVIRIEDGIIYLNGQEEYSPHIRENEIEWKDIKVTVPEDAVFVLGDNRNNSHDSLNFGAVPFKNIRGVANWIIWPPSRIGHPQKLH